MKNVVVYFSDIVGTLFGNQDNTEEDFKTFSGLLKEIKKNWQADEIIFSLISSDRQAIVSNTQIFLHDYIGGDVIFGKQFFDDGYYTEKGIVQKKSQGKALDIRNYLWELRGICDIVAVYYADDVSMYQMLLSCCAEGENWNNRLHLIHPMMRLGLSEINQLIKKDLLINYSDNNKQLIL